MSKTQEVYDQVNRGGSFAWGPAIKLLLERELVREMQADADAEPEPPAMPDPTACDVWGGSGGARATYNYDKAAREVSFLWVGGIMIHKCSLSDWHRWVRETGAKRIWPEGGGK